jgi:chemotaxis protein histidine kinase CheA
MVKEGLERFGGSILTESAEGVGTTFKVNLPIAPE